MLGKVEKTLEEWKSNHTMEQALAKITEACTEARLGYGQINVKTEKFTTQRAQRMVNSRHVKVLNMSINQQGLKSLEEPNFLHVGVRKSWLKRTCISSKVKKLPKVRVSLKVVLKHVY